MPLFQHEAMRLLTQTTSPAEVEDVLRAFVYSKFESGHDEIEVSDKFRRLSRYVKLRAPHIQAENKRVFARVSSEIPRMPLSRRSSMSDSSANSHASSVVGKEAWEKASQGSFSRSFSQVMNKWRRRRDGDDDEDDDDE
ncbi:hypothetical protein T439DRAFT_322020 [Meredithblackwellia eburnea MCA 4105]